MPEMAAVDGERRENSRIAVEISIHNNLEGLEADWRKLEQNANISIYQRFDWIRTCIDTIEKELKSQTLIITARQKGKLVFILPLAIEGGIVRKLRWVGGSHSNFNMPLIDEDFAATITHKDVQEIFRQIGRMLPGVGYMQLCCQPRVWGGADNALLALGHQRSINQAFGMDISGGFDALLSKGNERRKRKKFRAQMRVVEKFGGCELVLASSRAEVFKLLECFHRQKSARLRKQGSRDVFGGSEARSFLKKMALDSLKLDEPVLQLYALKVGGQYRAICGGGVLNRHFSAYFTSFKDDEFASNSPGWMLLYMLVEKLAADGFQSIDLGGGEERYKHSWCRETIEMFDVILPLSVFAYGHVWGLRLSFAMRRFVREQPRAWSGVKRARAAFGSMREIIFRKAV